MNIAVIGCGKMGTALIHGWLSAGITPASHIRVLTASPASAQTLHDHYGVVPATDINDATTGADFIVLAVKPFVMPTILPAVAAAIPANATIISVAAGIPLSSYEAVFGSETAIVRAMPNTPAGIQKGATGIAFNDAVPVGQRDTIVELFNAVGITEVVPESQMDAVNGLSGSGAGFAFTLIEAMIDGGVLAGLPRPVARRLAAQTMLGAAQLVLETNQHPGQLRDMVTTPNGTTMAGLIILENRAVRAAIMDAIVAAKNRSTELGEQYR
jgi:pyrroline-5-carboxylate reductase